jgi:hypothetical protein
MPIYPKVYSNEHTPRIPVANAVRISMSIPLFSAVHNAIIASVVRISLSVTKKGLEMLRDLGRRHTPIAQKKI